MGIHLPNLKASQKESHLMHNNLQFQKLDLFNKFKLVERR
jgi:hypothetical protein